MNKAPAHLVAQVAAGYVWRDPPPTYQEMDCQAFVEMCVGDAGGRMDYAGSNDMFRNACTRIMPLKEAQAAGLLEAGLLLFILEQDGKEPARYRADGIGNASHVGLYTDMHHQPTGRYVEVAHSSASKGIVCASTLKNAWTHVGWCKHIAYEKESAGQAEAQPVEHTERFALVDVPVGEHLRMRKTPSARGEYMQKIPRGERLKVIASRDGFGQVTYKGHMGWVSEAYLQYEAAGEAQGPGFSVLIDAYRGQPLTFEQASSILSEYLGAGYGGEVKAIVQ